MSCAIRPSSSSYEQSGRFSENYSLPQETSQDELLGPLAHLNERPLISGLPCPMPVPKHISEQAVTQIDAMIADTTINQQELIGRLKFIARLGYKAEELPEFWFNKCVGYLQYIAYNQTDRDDAFIHQEYAAALEMVLRKLNGKAPIPASLSTEPAYGKKVYNMRPDALKMKPKRKK